jgi:hypothetical protein
MLTKGCCSELRGIELDGLAHLDCCAVCALASRGQHMLGLVAHDK